MSRRCAYDSVHNVFYASGGTSPNIYVVSRDGTTVLDTITVLAGLTNPISGIAVAPKGLILAPSSDPNDDPSVMSLWVADYGRDQVMDGRLFEIKLGGSTTAPGGGTGGGSGTGTTDVTLTDGADSFLASSDENYKVAGLGGNDTISTRGGNDTITGGAGNDSISSGAGNDTILYGSGNNGYDAVDGGAGTDDRIVVTANSVTVGLFLALGLLVGIAALGVISTRSVVERRQQVGMLRAIGYQSRMVALSFLLESSLIALTGIAIGVIAGVVLGREIVSIFFETVSPDQVFALPWRQIGVIVLAAYGFSLLTTLLPAYQASRIYPAEALRYE